MQDLSNRRIAILATDGVDRSEIMEPLRALKDAGADVDVVSLETGSIRTWDDGDWSEPVSVDTTVDQAAVSDYEALILPGGTLNPDKLRRDENAVAFIREFDASGKPLAAICHAPWLLAEADVLRDRRITSFHSIRRDVENAGASWSDEPVVVDGNLITSRGPQDLDDFIGTIAEHLSETVPV